jgi:hypothetical protein
MASIITTLALTAALVVGVASAVVAERAAPGPARFGESHGIQTQRPIDRDGARPTTAPTTKGRVPASNSENDA